MAAGYAGRAGVFLRDFVNFAELVVRSYKASESYLDDRALSFAQRLQESTTDSQIKIFLDVFSKLLKALYRLEEILRAFEKVPTIKES